MCIDIISSKRIVTQLTTAAKLSKKSTPSICLSPRTQNLDMNLRIKPFRYRLDFKSNVEGKSCITLVRSTISYAFIV